MRILRERVVAELTRADVAGNYYNPANVYRSACMGYIPAGIAFPCVGVLDGVTEYEYPDGGGAIRTQELDIVIEMPLGEDDAALEDIMDAAEHIRACLEDDSLDLSDVESALPASISATSMTDGPGGVCVRKVLTMRYRRN